ncbi:MAG TPA: CotH kinase family protein [Prolixibacteraceae bacterium]|nr:CotH kinase family protein [Prolixibacteraceae bacterium]
MCLNLKFSFYSLLFLFVPLKGFTQTFSSSNLPLVVITTNGQNIADDPKIIADMGIIWNGSGKRNTLSDPKNNFNGKIGIEWRGSSSQSFPKKSYGFNLKSNALVNIDASLLGLPEENDWILYAPYTDKSMIRNVLTYTLDASLGHWSPRCRYVELFLNGSYEGVYVLMEKIKRNNNRVDIAKLTSTENSGEDLTGGYILKIDKTTGTGGDGWYSSYTNVINRTYYQYEYPKADEISSAQKSYIQTYVRNMEQLLSQEKFTGTGNYHDYLNDSSFIDFMIINELAKNVDGYRLSSFLYKDKNDRINCGPIWDFNLTYGNANYYNAWLTSGFQYQANLGDDYWQNPFWWNKLLRDPSYVTKLKKRWSWIRKHELSDQRIAIVIDSLTSEISEAQVRNYQRWPILGQYVWPNYYVGNSYVSEITWMKNWITNRLAFLDQQWPYDYTGNEDQLAIHSVSIFPNPFTDRITVQLSSGINGSGSAELRNITGKLVDIKSIQFQNGKIILDFSDQNSLNSGMYLLRIMKENKLILTRKIVKQL